MDSQAPLSSVLLEEARASLQDVGDPSARAIALAVLAATKELQDLARSAQSLDARLEALNQYLGAIANKP